MGKVLLVVYGARIFHSHVVAPNLNDVAVASVEDRPRMQRRGRWDRPKKTHVVRVVVLVPVDDDKEEGMGGDRDCDQSGNGEEEPCQRIEALPPRSRDMNCGDGVEL